MTKRHKNYQNNRHILNKPGTNTRKKLTDLTPEEKDFCDRAYFPNLPITHGIPNVTTIFCPGILHGCLHACQKIMENAIKVMDRGYKSIYDKFNGILISCSNFLGQGNIIICAELLFEMFHKLSISLTKF